MNKKKLIIENLKNIIQMCPVTKMQVHNLEMTVVCQTYDLLNLLIFLKNNILCQYKVLTCISGVDYPQNKYRFKVVYELLSIRYNSRIKVVIFLDELMVLDSSISIFSAAGWYECEIWDMFGIFFKNHINLKRLLTDYGFEGYPLRKDFPLSGFIEMRYNETKKRVTSDLLELSQEYRTFKFLSPWVK